MVVELQNSYGARLYSNWNGAVSIETSDGAEVVEINGLYGNKQGFKDGDEVWSLSLNVKHLKHSHWQ